MSRHLASPPLPVDLGSWLACFRFRLRNHEGHPLSPEQLGAELGVSGATVRRWEAGSGRPRAADLVHFSRVLRLSATQLAFLNLALAASEIVVSPDPGEFRRVAPAMLGSPFPAYLLDDLYYVRAWNSYVELLPGRVDLLQEGQFLEAVLPESLLPDYWRRVLIRDFWLLTADRCGVAAYREILERLDELPGFREEWTGLALSDEPEDALPVGAPVTLHRADGGSFRVYSTRVLLPPAYYLREYVPVDEVAAERLARLRRAGPAKVHLRARAHWAEEGRT